MITDLVAAVPLLLWLYLLLGRGRFWRVSRHVRTSRPSRLAAGPRVVAVIPARNEAEVISRSIRSLLNQTMPLQIVMVDDGSTDGTAEVANSIASANLTIVSGSPLPPGWTGKLWALSQGVAHAERLAPDYFLFTDADIEHAPNAIRELVATAEERKLDLASYMVRLACVTTAEKALIPAFVFFFLKLYPPSWTASALRRTAGAAGGCMLIRRETLQRIGGLASLSSEIIDDCALARAVKRSGGRIWMGLSADARSIRSYETFAEIGRMIARTAFYQLHHSTLLLVATIAGLFVTYLIPPLLLVCGSVVSGRRTLAMLGAAAWTLMTIAYLPMIRFYRRPPLWAVTLPAVALFYAGATVYSALTYWRGKGGEWKGRAQDVRASM